MTTNRVLVIDDQEREAERVAEVLKKALSCEAEFTADSSQALKLCVEKKFDLVITDFRMPKRDGLALLAEIKSLSPECEVIVVTAYPQIESAIDAMKLGAVDYLGRRESAELWLERIAVSAKKALRIRPSRRSPGFHRENLIHFLWSRLDSTDIEFEEGQLAPGLALEYLTKLLLESCTGFEVTYHRFRTSNEEHDVVCLNQAVTSFWTRQAPIILVECKDRRSMIAGDTERGRLEQKIRNRQGQSTVGIYVSSSGFTATFHRPLSQSPVPGGPPPIIIPINKESLLEWIESYDRLDWITQRAITAIF